MAVTSGRTARRLAIPWPCHGFAGSVGVGSVLAIRRPEWRKWLAVLACIAVYLPISSFTVSGLWATHIFILLPLPQWVTACAAVWVAEAILSLRRFHDSLGLARAPLATFALAAICVALPFSRDLWVSARRRRVPGPDGRFGALLRRGVWDVCLAGWSEDRRAYRPRLGIKANMEVTAGRVRPLEIHYFTGEPVGALQAAGARLAGRPSPGLYRVVVGRQNQRRDLPFSITAPSSSSSPASRASRSVRSLSRPSAVVCPVYVALMAK